MTAALEYLSTALVLVAVWRIGKLDLRGQYLMLVAQLGWAVYAATTRQWGLLAQSLVLLLLTRKAIRNWRAAMFRRIGG